MTIEHPFDETGVTAASVGTQATSFADGLDFATVDQDAARDWASATFAPHQLHIGGRERINFRSRVIPSPRLTMGTMRYGATVTMKAQPLETCYHLIFPACGDNHVSQNGVSSHVIADRVGVVLDPRYPLSIAWSSDSWQYHIKIPTWILDSHAARLAGRGIEGVRFGLEIDITTGAGRALFSMVEFFAREFSKDEGLGANPLACRELEAAFMSQLLIACPNQFSTDLFADSGRTTRSSMSRVLDYIDANLGVEISSADLTIVAGVGLRALQTAFRSATGMSPTAYLRGQRLDRVRLELSHGSEELITNIAARWGFYHLGRFAYQYRERFGELPSETARGNAVSRSHNVHGSAPSSTA
jgi:AraC-like DNA-binding protein